MTLHLPHEEGERWNIVRSEFESVAQNKIGNAKDLTDAIARKVVRHPSVTHLYTDGLAAFLDHELSADERKRFFDLTLPSMAFQGLRSPELFPVDNPIPLLSQRVGANEIRLSLEQCACLLAHCFFCSADPFPSRIPDQWDEEYNMFCFAPIFELPVEFMFAKLHCFINYFHRTCAETRENLSERRVVTIRRHVIEELPDWRASECTLSNLEVREQGVIEEVSGALQADFANKFIGGGVLGTGRVQEEIKFTVAPECLLSLALCETMKDNEAILIRGAQQYSSFSGYAKSFRFTGDFRDPSAANVDADGHACIDVVGFDAVPFFGRNDQQFEEKWILRELNKCFCAFTCDFRSTRGTCSRSPPIATGNWGCGAFGGDHQLKAIIQVLAAAMAGRDLIYCTFGSPHIAADALRAVHQHMCSRRASVGAIFRNLVTWKNPCKGHLFDWLKSVV